MLRFFDQSLHWIHRWLSYKFKFVADIRTWSQRMFGNKLSDLLELKFLLHIVFEGTNVNWTGVRLRRLYRHTRRRKFFCSERGSLIIFCCCCEKQQLKKKQHWTNSSRLEMEWKELLQKNPSGKRLKRMSGSKSLAGNPLIRDIQCFKWHKTEHKHTRKWPNWNVCFD